MLQHKQPLIVSLLQYQYYQLMLWHKVVICYSHPFLHLRVSYIQHQLEEYLNSQSEKIYNRPWNKLEPKYKIDRFSNYVNSQSEWSEDDKKDALHFLESCLQLNYLIKGTEVDYDVEEGVINNIKKINIDEVDGKKKFSLITPAVKKGKTKEKTKS